MNDETTKGRINNKQWEIILALAYVFRYTIIELCISEY